MRRKREEGGGRREEGGGKEDDRLIQWIKISLYFFISLPRRVQGAWANI
jgi:hypothetical protein